MIFKNIYQSKGSNKHIESYGAASAAVIAYYLFIKI